MIELRTGLEGFKTTYRTRSAAASARSDGQNTKISPYLRATLSKSRYNLEDDNVSNVSRKTSKRLKTVRTNHSEKSSSSRSDFETTDSENSIDPSNSYRVNSRISTTSSSRKFNDILGPPSMATMVSNSTAVPDFNKVVKCIRRSQRNAKKQDTSILTNRDTNKKQTKSCNDDDTSINENNNDDDDDDESSDDFYHTSNSVSLESSIKDDDSDEEYIPIEENINDINKKDLKLVRKDTSKKRKLIDSNRNNGRRNKNKNTDDDDGYHSDSTTVSRLTITSKHSMTSYNSFNSYNNPSKENIIESVNDLYHEAKILFRRSLKPNALIGRNKEKECIIEFFKNHVFNTTSITGSLYISGSPGTGKTALMDELLSQHRDVIKKSNICIIKFNCMTAKDPRSIFSSLLKQMTGKQLSSKEAFVELKEILVPLKVKSKPIRYLVILDEIDYLITKNQEILYSFFELAISQNSQLSLIGIANALDLTERFLPRLKAKGYSPMLLNFNPYEMMQIKEIITYKVKQFNMYLNNLLKSVGRIGNNNVPRSDSTSSINSLTSSSSSSSLSSSNIVPDINKINSSNDKSNLEYNFNIIEPMAVELCARKIASTGDVRKALDICRLAIEMTETEVKLNKRLENDSSVSSGFKNEGDVIENLVKNELKSVSIKHMIMATKSAFGNDNSSQKIKSMGLQLKLVLCAMIRMTNKKGDFDITNIYGNYVNICKYPTISIPPVSRTELQDLLTNLEAYGILSVSNNMRRNKDMASLKKIIQLNVQKTEILDAIRDMPSLISLMENGGNQYQMKANYVY